MSLHFQYEDLSKMPNRILRDNVLTLKLVRFQPEGALEYPMTCFLWHAFVSTLESCMILPDILFYEQTNKSIAAII